MIIKGWFLKGSKPRVSYTWTRDKICVFGALSKNFFSAKLAENLDNKTYLPFVKSLLRKYGNVIIVVDGAKYHFERKHVQKFYEENKHKLKVIQFPAYSPELNPVEPVWKKIKKWLANRIWFNKEELEQQLIFALNNPFFMSPMFDYLCT